jgi:hypothetical protein
MASDPVASVGEVVWQLDNAIETAAAAARRAKKSAALRGTEKEVISASLGPHEARQ